MSVSRHMRSLERLRLYLIERAEEREGNGWPADMERAEAAAVEWAILELRPLYEPVRREVVA